MRRATLTRNGHKLTVTTDVGQTFTRETVRPYTHIVTHAYPGHVTLLSWHGSYRGALAELRKRARWATTATLNEYSGVIFELKEV